MSGPWEDYAPTSPASDGPWNDYTPASTRKSPMQMAESEQPAMSGWDSFKRELGLTARAALEGVTALPNIAASIPSMAINAGRSLYNKAADSDLPMLPTATGAFSQGLTEMGLPNPSTQTERVVGDVVGSMAGAGGMIKLSELGAKLASTPLARQVLNALTQAPGLQMASAGAAAGAGGTAREMGAGPGMEALVGFAGGMVPLGGALMRIPSWSTRNAGKIMREALKDTTPEEIEQAKILLGKSKTEGVPLMGPEGFRGGSPIQQVASNVMASPAAGSKMAEFAKNRPEQVEEAGRVRLADIGKYIGGQEAANQAESAATKVESDVQKFRTEAASPDYKAARASDAEAMKLMDEIKSTQQDIKDGTAWKNDAIHQAGQWYAFSHEMGLKANEVAQKALGWAGDKAAAKYMARADEGRAATNEAVTEASNRQNYIDQWQKDVEAKQDALAQKNLPFVEEKIRGYMSSLDQAIKLANPATTEGKILADFKNELAPNGKPITFPSQLESIYKANRDKLELGLQPTSIERTQAGVLKRYVKSLDGLIQEVSPSIKQGRKIYEEMSREFVDPLLKGPIGRIAGKGADAQKEAAYSRVFSELQSDIATPQRISLIADKLGKVDKEAFPNMVRAHLENKFDKSLQDLQGQRNRMSGSNFRNAIAGTPKERANLSAMIGKVAETQGQDPKKAVAGFNDMLEIFDATGRIPGMGSQTGSRAEMAKTARESATADVVNVGGALTGHSIAERIRDIVYRGTYRKLADVFTSKDSISQMVELSKPGKDMSIRQRIIADLLGSAYTKKGSGEDENDSK